MNSIAAFADQWGWTITILAGTGYIIAKNFNKVLAFLARFFPILEHRQMTKREAQKFAQEQKAKAATLSFEEQERRDTIVALNHTLSMLVEDKKQAHQERLDLQSQLVDIIKEQSRREAEITNALQDLSRVVVLQTERLTDLVSAIECFRKNEKKCPT